MPIIDYTYFVKKLNLPQTGDTLGRQNIESFIETYEPLYLKKILGYELSKLFMEGIQGSGDPDQRWIDLLEGKEFTYYGKLNKWMGFSNTDLLSPIANFIYYQFMEESAYDVALVGTSAGDVENATRVSGISKMIDAWNEMSSMNRTLAKFLNANKSIYPEWEGMYQYDVLNELYKFKNSFDL